MDLLCVELFKLVKFSKKCSRHCDIYDKMSYISGHLNFIGMRKIWKKLVEMAVVALVPVVIDYMKELLDDLKKKIQAENSAS